VTAFWFGLAIVVGVGLRFLEVPEFLLPVLVGVGVAATVVFLLRPSLFVQETKPAPTQDSNARNGRLSRGRSLAVRLEETRPPRPRPPSTGVRPALRSAAQPKTDVNGN
jgi:hypothetical protein